MATIPPRVSDPTLDAVDAAIEAAENGKRTRGYLGMSGIGRNCERQIWYEYRFAKKVRFDAATLKKFADGHASEDVQAARLRMVPGIELHTIDAETGRQIGVSDHDGHFRGHLDGAILGLLQAPKTWHVWEHKCTNEKKQAELEKLKATHGEKNAFAQWDGTYYAQAQLYMHYTGMTRHYLTVSTPGGRHTISCRTDYDMAAALRIVEKARRVIEANEPPPRIAANADWYECKWCAFYDICWKGALPDKNCRTCLHSSTAPEGKRTCTLWRTDLTLEAQEAGCPSQLLLPGLVPGEQVDADPHGSFVEYRMPDGTLWRDVAVVCPF